MTHRSPPIPPAAWAGLLTVALLWGGSFLSIHVALAEVPTLTLVTFRVGGAALALWLYVWLARLPVPRGGRAWVGLAGMGLLNNALPFTLIAWGQKTIPSGLAAILNASTAIFGVLIAAALLRDERLTLRKSAGVALGFAGVAVAIGIENLAALDLRSLAQLAVIGASVSYAVSNVWARLMMQGIPPVTAAAGMLSCSSAMMLPLALLVDGVPDFGYALTTWAALGWLALMSSALAYILFYRILAQIGAGNTSVITLLVAPVAILLGAVVLGEALRPAAYLGFALLTAGLLVLDGRLVTRLTRRGVAQ
jgi:drug/metabolite transporter (DMT)-like permease